MEKQKEEQAAAGFKAQQLQQKQQLAADSEGEEEESKETQNSNTEDTIIDTSATNPEEAEGDDTALGEIDEILDDNYQQAVQNRQRQGLSATKLQAEPSHFHLAALEKERARRPLKKAADLQQETEESKQENWVVTDNIPMKNFAQLV